MDQIQKVYIETSVWGMTLPRQPRALRQPSLEFLRQCRLGIFEPYISTVVLDEVQEAKAPRANRILAEIERHHLSVLEPTREAERLADEYVKAEIIPRKKHDDAMHVAIATVFQMDVLVSWNQRHLVNVRKKQLFITVNRLAGHEHEILIHTPFEVLR